MDEHFCPMCGEHHGGLAAEAEAEIITAAEVTSAEVRIAEINADRDVKLARIQAGIIENQVVVEAAVDAAHAEGEADGLREAIAPEPAPEPIIIDAAEAAADAPADDAPPEVEGSEPPAAKRKTVGLGAW